MRKKAYLKSSVAALPLGAGLLGLSLAPALASFAGPVGADTSGPGTTITIDVNGNATLSFSGQGPYDSADDTYVGVVNNSGNAISSLSISCNTDCFGFDGDGINTYLGISNNSNDTSGYGGVNAYFTNVVGDSGTVNFLTAIAANGGTSYFSLEENLTAANFSSITIGPTPLPSTWTMLLLGLVGVGFASYRTKTRQSSVAIA